MSLTLSEAVADVRQLLNEPTAVFWADAEIEDWIKEGVRIIASKTLSVEADEDLTLVTNQLIYTSAGHSWIGDCLEPYAAIYNNGANKYKGLEFIHPKQIGNSLTFTAGAPRYYSFHNRSFYVWPLPSTGTNGNTVSVLYAKETEDITAILDEYQHLAVIWAQARAYEKDHKHQMAAGLKQHFMTDANFERQDKTNRPGEGVASVKSGKPTTR